MVCRRDPNQEPHQSMSMLLWSARKRGRYWKEQPKSLLQPRLWPIQKPFIPTIRQQADLRILATKTTVMYSASCTCNKCKITISKIVSTAICHCTLCRKVTSSIYSLNAVVPSEELKVEMGVPKRCTLPSETGVKPTLYFCGDCGSALWSESAGIPGLRTVKAGVIDGLDALGSEDFKPRAEQFIERRPSWLHGVAGTTQVEGLQEGVREILMRKLQRANM